MRTFVLFVALLGLWMAPSSACTSVVVSGRVTPDGRPLLLKNRDTHDQNNHVVKVKGEKYTFLAVASDRDRDVKSIWQGHNSAGFAIANTAAYNMNGKGGHGDEQDGRIMRRALEICASAKDFELMLDTMRQAEHLRANSNFAVIDAQCAAAYYETGDKGYVSYDANDPTVAPYGYLVRTNFAFSGDRSLDQGTERYLAAADFMQTAAFMQRLDGNYILQQLPRYLHHGLTRVNLWNQEPASLAATTIVNFEDFIPRYFSASTTLIKGVRKGEDPMLTVSYTIVGNPLTAPVIPLLISDAALPEVVLGTGDDNHSWLCQKSISRKQMIFINHHGHVTDYVDLAQIINREGTGSLQQLEPIEDEILSRGEVVIDRLRTGDSRAVATLTDYYRWVDNYLKSLKYWS